MAAYYKSHQKLAFIGADGQQLLQKAAVLVIGAGGLGCPCLQFLAGCGIGTIGIADFDTIAESNLHRQILFSVADIGKPKAQTAAKKLAAHNPYIQFEIYDSLIDRDNILGIIQQYDVIVDCTDNFTVRYLINDACILSNKPLVYGAIHQTEGHVTVFNYNGSPGLRSLFPEANESIQSCADIGAYNIITGIIGTMLSNEVIKILTKQGGVLAGKLNCFDALTGLTKQIHYTEAPGSRQISADKFNEPSTSIEITAQQLQEKIANKESFLLIDVRDQDERELYNIGGEHIPLNQLLQSLVPLSISPQTDIIVYCQSGERSLMAAKFLLNNGFLKCVSLKGGIRPF